MKQQQQPNRRDFLFRSALGLGSVALGDLLLRNNVGQANGTPNLQAAKKPVFAGKARHVIFLFMQGGPSQLETFDPKPQMKKFDGQLLPKELRDFDLAQINTADAKILAPVFEFQQHGESGIEISSLFPQLAKHADKLAVIRSCWSMISLNRRDFVGSSTGLGMLAASV